MIVCYQYKTFLGSMAYYYFSQSHYPFDGELGLSDIICAWKIKTKK